MIKDGDNKDLQGKMNEQVIEFALKYKTYLRKLDTQFYTHAYLDHLCHYYLQTLVSISNNLSPEVPAVVLKFHPSIWNYFF